MTENTDDTDVSVDKKASYRPFRDSMADKHDFNKETTLDFMFDFIESAEQVYDGEEVSRLFVALAMGMREMMTGALSIKPEHYEAFKQQVDRRRARREYWRLMPATQIDDREKN
jgi:hypothetical protein